VPGYAEAEPALHASAAATATAAEARPAASNNNSNSNSASNSNSNTTPARSQASPGRMPSGGPGSTGSYASSAGRLSVGSALAAGGDSQNSSQVSKARLGYSIAYFFSF
jgi:hypothetical protein